MLAREIMTSPVITIGIDRTIGDAAELMLRREVSCLPVINETGAPVGMLTHADFVLHPKFMPMGGEVHTLFGTLTTPETSEELARYLQTRPLKDVMHSPVITIKEDSSFADAVTVMLREKVSRIPVMSKDELLGIITRHDLLKLFVMDWKRPT